MNLDYLPNPLATPRSTGWWLASLAAVAGQAVAAALFVVGIIGALVAHYNPALWVLGPVAAWAGLRFLAARLRFWAFADVPGAFGVYTVDHFDDAMLRMRWAHLLPVIVSNAATVGAYWWLFPTHTDLFPYLGSLVAAAGFAGAVLAGADIGTAFLRWVRGGRRFFDVVFVAQAIILGYAAFLLWMFANNNYPFPFHTHTRYEDQRAIATAGVIYAVVLLIARLLGWRLPRLPEPGMSIRLRLVGVARVGS